MIPGNLANGSEGIILTDATTPSYLVTALKVISYCTFLTPLIMLIVKAGFRFLHQYHIIDVKQKLAEGVKITPEIINKIENYLRGKDYSDVKQYPCSVINNVFSFKSIPDLIFKTTGSQSRFQNMVEGLEVCLVHQLDLLIIPSSTEFEVEINGKKQRVIAEQFIPIQDTSVQKKLYQTLSGLDETVRQLTQFIIKTGLHDVERRNIPIVNKKPTSLGERHVALIDLEQMGSVKEGLFGGMWGSSGLINCLLSERHIDIALSEANKAGVIPKNINLEELKKYRMREIADCEKLQQYYLRKGIMEENAKQPIQVDLNTLGLNLEEQVTLKLTKKEADFYNININNLIKKPEMPFLRRLVSTVFPRNSGNQTANNGVQDANEELSVTITLKEVVVRVIDGINQAIQVAPHDSSIEGKRNISLNKRLENCKLNFEFYDWLSSDGCKPWNNENERKQKWLFRIFAALMDKECIFRFEGNDSTCYRIQA